MPLRLVRSSTAAFSYLSTVLMLGILSSSCNEPKKNECGDDHVGGSEQCDGLDLNEATCQSLGFYFASPLACSLICTYDTSACLGKCGDGTLDMGHEQCDGIQLGGKTCQDFGYHGGILSCSPQCGYDTSGCTGRCGDGVVQATYEQCEPTVAITGRACADYGFYGGSLTCTSGCAIDPSTCSGFCGDGTRNGTEPCEGKECWQCQDRITSRARQSCAIGEPIRSCFCKPIKI